MKIRRNTVVKESDNVSPARVWKILDDEHCIIICCGLHVRQVRMADLEVLDYKGRWIESYTGRYFLGMSRLRSLLKGARNYNPELIPENINEFV